MGNKNIYERFTWFDSKVRAGKYPNASMLAGKFEISGKTAQRDIEFMRDRLSCPLVYDKKKKGYHYESDSFSLPVTYLSGDELSMLLLSRKLLQDINGEYIKMVTLRFSPKRSRWIKNQIWHKDQQVRHLDDGSLELSFPVASFNEVEMQVLSHGHDVEVISPQSFRQLIKAEAEKIAGIY